MTHLCVSGPGSLYSSHGSVTDTCFGGLIRICTTSEWASGGRGIHPLTFSSTSLKDC